MTRKASMIIKFECPNCTQPIEAPDEMIGMDVECPGCGKTINVGPTETHPPPPPPFTRPPEPRQQKVDLPESERISRTAQNISKVGTLLAFIGIGIALFGILRKPFDVSWSKSCQRFAEDTDRENYNAVLDAKEGSPARAEAWKKYEEDRGIHIRWISDTQSAIQPRFVVTERAGAVCFAFGLVVVCCAQLWHIRSRQAKMAETMLNEIRNLRDPQAESADTQNAALATSESEKRILPALMLCFFLGIFGAHAFYAGRWKQGIVILSAFVTPLVSFLAPSIVFPWPISLIFIPLLILLVFIAVFCDLIRILVGAYQDGEGRKIKRWP
jgi:hypothetical protein